MTTQERERLEGIVLDTVMCSMSFEELAQYYVETISEEALIEWASDADGNLPEGLNNDD